MDELLKRIHEETHRLSWVGMEAGYEEYVQLVEWRQQFMDAIAGKGELAASEKKLVQEILAQDSTILSHMQQLKEEAQEALHRIHSSRKQRDAYQKSEYYDSFMFDTRK